VSTALLVRHSCSQPTPSSLHAQVSSPTQIAEMETAVKQLDSELTMCGISLKELTNTHELMMCEYGFGGGTSGDGTAPAQSAFEVGTFSYFGILGPYRRWDWCWGREGACWRCSSCRVLTAVPLVQWNGAVNSATVEMLRFACMQSKCMHKVCCAAASSGDLRYGQLLPWCITGS
jgi:hypothetical protein